jgi:superfamily II DNA/RNA helicase
MIIATPGRLTDHLNRRTIQLNQTRILVLDEADRMLDMGFAPQLGHILRFLPNARQTLLFSATWESSLDQLSKKYLRNPIRVAVGSTSQAAPTIEQTAISTTGKDKNETLLDVLNERQGSVLIFARTKSRTDRLARYLHSYGLEVGRIHGGRTQGQRNSALHAFKTGRVRILVATDIAARGIDVAQIAHVINYDLPQAPEDYIHRIGRTGRAGAKGEALSILTPEDRLKWKDISRLLKKTGSALPQLRELTSSA